MEKYSDFANKNGVAIPIIQRDYVQGAKVNFEKRNKFLSSLLDALLQGTPYEIDFIYGSSDGDEKQHFFIPVDGQQRLTTLALLGWILNQKSSGQYNEQFKELTYTTRPSTEQFCKELFAYQLPENYDTGDGTISSHIKSVPGWFTRRWLFDPSVNAMLDFLDTADEMLKQQKYAGHISEITYRFFNDSPIKFERLDMNALHLNDDLYIKMNARGKLLTPFEHWKAEFEGHLKDPKFSGVYYDKEIPDITGKPTLSEYFEYAIEHDWCDLLWPIAYNRWNELEPEEQRRVLYPRIDEFFMYLFDYISRFMLFASIKDTESELKDKPYKEVRMLYDYEKDKSRIGIYNNVDNVCKLFRILDLFVELNKYGFKKFFGQYFINTKSLERLNTADKFKVNLYDKSVDLFTLCIDNDLDTTTEVILWAVLEWLVQHPNCIKATNADSDMTDYLRIVMGWARGRRQRLTSGLSVSTNLRLDDYYEANQIIVTLANAKNGNELFNVLAATQHKSLSAEREKGQYYNTPKFDVIRELSTCVELYYCFNLLWPSLNVATNINAYVDRFYKFMAQDDVKRIQELNSHGFSGVCPMNYYYFYGQKGKWDYIFTIDKAPKDKNYQNAVNAFTAWMNQEPKLSFKPDQMAYYLDKYPDFIKARYNYQYPGEPCHYFNYVNNEFEIWAVKTFSTNPILGYNVDPYGYVVEKLYKGPNKLFARSENSEHGVLWIGNGMYMECVSDGWEIVLTDRRCTATKQFLNRFKENTDGSFADPQGVFTFNGIILQDLEDRIQTALMFLEVIS